MEHLLARVAVQHEPAVRAVLPAWEAPVAEVPAEEVPAAEVVAVGGGKQKP